MFCVLFVISVFTATKTNLKILTKWIPSECDNLIIFDRGSILFKDMFNESHDWFLLSLQQNLHSSYWQQLMPFTIFQS